MNAFELVSGAAHPLNEARGWLNLGSEAESAAPRSAFRDIDAPSTDDRFTRGPWDCRYVVGDNSDTGDAWLSFTVSREGKEVVRYTLSVLEGYNHCSESTAETEDGEPACEWSFTRGDSPYFHEFVLEMYGKEIGDGDELFPDMPLEERRDSASPFAVSMIIKVLRRLADHYPVQPSPQ